MYVESPYHTRLGSLGKVTHVIVLSAVGFKIHNPKLGDFTSEDYQVGDFHGQLWGRGHIYLTKQQRKEKNGVSARRGG